MTTTRSILGLQRRARRNALTASIALARRRRELAEVEQYLALLHAGRTA